MPFYPSPLRDDGYDIADYRDDQPVLRHDARLPRLRRRGARARPPRHHRARHQPHLRPASLVPARAAREARLAGARLLRLERHRPTATPRRGSSSSTPRSRTGPGTRRPRPISGTASIRTSPTSTSTTRRCMAEVKRLLHYWLDMGVDGLRLDAIPYLVERDGTNNENLPETHAVLKELRAEMDRYYPDRMLLAEANQWPEDTRPYFGDGDECHMAFHFPLMPRMYMAVAQEDRHPITDIIRQTPDIPDDCQWAIFLRNHDELTLEMVTGEERDYLWRTYAKDSARPHQSRHPPPAGAADGQRPAQDRADERAAVVDARHAGRLLRRRDRHGRQLLSSATATACARRCSGRPTATAASAAPTRRRSTCRRSWTRSTASRRSTSRPQQGEANSLLNWMRRMIAVRKQHRAFGRGTLHLLYPHQPQDPRLCPRARGRAHPLRLQPVARQAQAVEIDLSRVARRGADRADRRRGLPAGGDLPYLLTLPAYGFFWFLLADEAEAPRWRVQTPGAAARIRHASPRPAAAFARALADGAERRLLERYALPAFMAGQRWFADKGAQIGKVDAEPIATIPGDENRLLIVSAETGRWRARSATWCRSRCCGARRTSASARRSCRGRWPRSAPGRRSARSSTRPTTSASTAT